MAAENMSNEYLMSLYIDSKQLAPASGTSEPAQDDVVLVLRPSNPPAAVRAKATGRPAEIVATLKRATRRHRGFQDAVFPLRETVVLSDVCPAEVDAVFDDAIIACTFSAENDIPCTCYDWAAFTLPADVAELIDAIKRSAEASENELPDKLALIRRFGDKFFGPHSELLEYGAGGLKCFIKTKFGFSDTIWSFLTDEDEWLVPDMVQ